MSSRGSMIASSALLPSRGRGNLLECNPEFLSCEEEEEVEEGEEEEVEVEEGDREGVKKGE